VLDEEVLTLKKEIGSPALKEASSFCLTPQTPGKSGIEPDFD
jgi:hypothetical protein